MNKPAILFLFSVLIISCNSDNKKESQTQQVQNVTPTLNYELVGTLPHDINSFTEGLLVQDGKIYESTGSPAELPFAQSHFGILDTTSGKIQVKASLDRNKYFGEGLNIIDGKIYQLTYTTQTCFVYDAKTFKLLNTFKYNNPEGWGLTNDGKNLIMSDGSYRLTYINPADFSKIKEINVTENGYAIEKINELEYVNGFIYANVWTTNLILKIDANTGRVVAKNDFGNLYRDAQQNNTGIMEMNGIAYDPAKDEFLLTGKLWPKIYRVKFK